jgi:glycosyltransferase involved in cell wall biosynthesis
VTHDSPLALNLIKQVMAMQVMRTEEQRRLYEQQYSANVEISILERWMLMAQVKDWQIIDLLHTLMDQPAQNHQVAAQQNHAEASAGVTSGQPTPNRTGARWRKVWHALTHPRQAAKKAARKAYHAAVPLDTRLQIRARYPHLREYLRSPHYYLPRAAYYIAVPRPLRMRFRAYRSKLHMNWYVYAFDRFKRARAATYGDNIAGIRTPAQPGLVTIVLPAYNGEDMVGDAIETVLAQTYPNWELICIDDGSTDRTGEILDEYAQRDPRIRVVHQENRKIPRTLSRGFQMARGEFFTWTSCDNRLKPDFLQKMVGSLQRNPCWDGIYANVDIIGEDGRYLRNSPWYEGYQQPPGSEHVHLPETTGELNTWPNNSVGAAFMYRARVAYLLGDYSRFRFTTEDYDYWMRMNALFHLRHSDFPDPVYDYRFHDRSLTSKDKELGITRSRDRLMVFEDFRRDFYLTPLIWVIDADSGGQAAAAALRQQVERAGHLVYTGADYTFDQLPPLWTPVIYIYFTGHPSADCEPPSSLPPSALRALVAAVSPGTPLPDTMHNGWHTCVSVGHDVPLPRLSGPYQGWLGVGDAANVFHALDSRAKEFHLSQIEALIEAPPPAEKRASVIICTYRLNERLESAIRSVAKQPVQNYEVILVNNNPANRGIIALIDRLREEVFGGSPERLRLVVCPIPGLSAARNAGIAAARGSYLCFMDDDAIAAPDWLQQVCESFDAHPETGVVGGHIVLKIPEPRPRALQPGWEKYWSQFVTGYTDYAEVEHWWEFPWGANWSARRQAMLQAGGFRTRYGRSGSDFGGGEEVAAASLIQRLEYRIAIQPCAVVQHDVEPNRYTFRHVRRTLLAGHISQYRLQHDLYIPMTPILRSSLAQLLKVHADPYLPRRSRAWLLDLLFRKPVQLRLFAFQLRDLRARFRTPIVNAKICDR